MWLFYCFLVACKALKVTNYPRFGAPPVYLLTSAATYDSYTNSIITVGGEQSSDGIKISDVYFFNLTTKQWSSPRLSSSTVPPGLSRHKIYLRSDRKVLIIGTFLDVYIFNLEDYSWTTEKLQGDLLNGVFGFGMAGFTLNDTEYVAIFGGSTQYEYTNSLFLIDVKNLTSTKLPNNGKFPSPRMDTSLEFYNNSLYMYGYSSDDYLGGKETGSELYRYDLENYYWEIVETIGAQPGPRTTHYSSVYNDEMFIFYGMIPEFVYPFMTVYKFNFINKLWMPVEHSKPITELKFSSAHVSVKEKIYLIYGYNTNSILEFDLSSPGLIPVYTSPAIYLPSERLFHCSFKVNQNLYIFGGTNNANDESQVYLNDMWAFNFETLTWSSVSTQGSIPSGRKSFACAKTLDNGVVIFGGKGSEGYLNDFYYFYEPTKTWYSKIPSGVTISPRSHSCICTTGNVAYIIGGKIQNKAFSEVYKYDFVLNTMTLIDIKIGGDKQAIKDIYDAYCWIDVQEDYSLLNVVSGIDSSRTNNYELYKVYMYSNDSYYTEIKVIGNHSAQAIFAAESAIVKWNDYIIRIAGTLYSWAMVQNIFIYNAKTEEYKIISTRNVFSAYGHSAVHYKNSLYIFGGGAAIGIYKSSKAFSKLLIKLDFEDSEFPLGCSQGTYLQSCEPCPLGTYYSENDCIKCPKGSYGPLLGSESLSQCIMCPEGTFSDRSGLKQCLICDSLYYCSLGSQSTSYYLSLPTNSSVQPKDLELESEYISSLMNELWVIVGGIAGAIVFASVMFISIWNSLKKIDFFSSNHNNRVGVPVIYRKTSIGGLFFVIFVLISSVIFIASFLTYQLNNVSEYKSLIPMILVDTQIQSKSVILHSVFYLYGGECIINNECNPLLKISDEGLSYTSKKITCEFIKQNCLVTIEFTDLYFNQKSSNIYISFEEYSSFASAISINLTSYSSIPNESSSLSLAFETGTKGTLFKGTSPTTINCQFIPSVTNIQIFYSDSSNWVNQDTGFHIYYNKETQLGGIVDQFNFNFNLYLRLKISITETENAIQTLRKLNQTWFIFIGSILGSIFGLMGSVVSLMSIVENFYDRFTKKIEQKQGLDKIINKNLEICRQMKPEENVQKNNKIAPLKYEIKETYCERDTQFWPSCSIKRSYKK